MTKILSVSVPLYLSVLTWTHHHPSLICCQAWLSATIHLPNSWKGLYTFPLLPALLMPWDLLAFSACPVDPTQPLRLCSNGHFLENKLVLEMGSVMLPSPPRSVEHYVPDASCSTHEHVPGSFHQLDVPGPAGPQKVLTICSDSQFPQAKGCGLTGYWIRPGRLVVARPAEVISAQEEGFSQSKKLILSCS